MIKERCPKCGAKPKCGWLYNILEIRGGIRVSLKLSLEQTRKLYDKTNREFQGNLKAAMRRAIELLVKYYTGIKTFSGRNPVRDTTLGYECSECGFVWKIGEDKKLVSVNEKF